MLPKYVAHKAAKILVHSWHEIMTSYNLFWKQGRSMNLPIFHKPYNQQAKELSIKLISKKNDLS